RDDTLRQRAVSSLNGHARPHLRPAVGVDDRRDSRRGRATALRRPRTGLRGPDARCGARDHARTDPVARGLRAGSTALLPVEPSVIPRLRPLRPPGSEQLATWRPMGRTAPAGGAIAPVPAGG